MNISVTETMPACSRKELLTSVFDLLVSLLTWLGTLVIYFLQMWSLSPYCYLPLFVAEVLGIQDGKVRFPARKKA